MRTIVLKYAGACDHCHKAMARGATALHIARGVVRHVSCVKPDPAADAYNPDNIVSEFEYQLGQERDFC